MPTSYQTWTGQYTLSNGLLLKAFLKAEQFEIAGPITWSAVVDYPPHTYKTKVTMPDEGKARWAIYLFGHNGGTKITVLTEDYDGLADNQIPDAATADIALSVRPSDDAEVEIGMRPAEFVGWEEEIPEDAGEDDVHNPAAPTLPITVPDAVARFIDTMAAIDGTTPEFLVVAILSQWVSATRRAVQNLIPDSRF